MGADAARCLSKRSLTDGLNRRKRINHFTPPTDIHHFHLPLPPSTRQLLKEARLALSASQRATWRVLRNYSELKHVFAVPCNSHGLQLAIKDLLENHKKRLLTQVQQCHQIAIRICRLFRTAPTLLAILREEQITAYSKKITLVVSVITRWGSQFGLLQSVHANLAALVHFKARIKPQRHQKDT